MTSLCILLLGHFILPDSCKMGGGCVSIGNVVELLITVNDWKRHVAKWLVRRDFPSRRRSGGLVLASPPRQPVMLRTNWTSTLAWLPTARTVAKRNIYLSPLGLNMRWIVFGRMLTVILQLALFPTYSHRLRRGQELDCVTGVLATTICHGFRKCCQYRCI